jgi:hypothetical protein
MAASPQPTTSPASTEVLAVPTATDRRARLAMILGISSCVPAIGVIFCIPAIIMGHLALNRTRRASQPLDIRIVVGLALGYVIALIYTWMMIGLFIVPALSGR